MYQHILATYRRVTRLTGQSTSARKSIPLSVVALEERVTPTVLPVFQAPETLRILEVPQVQPPPYPAERPNASVRSDLFGVGGAGQTETAKELDEMLTADHDANEEVASEPAKTRPEIVVGSAEVIVVSADETWLPPLE